MTMSGKVIHFFKYLEYDDLYKIGFQFDTLTKSSLNTYIAKLKKPIFFILPKNEVLDLKQDNFGNNIFQYIIDVDNHLSFMTFLDNLDSLCVNLASENSESWFKKHMDSRTLVELYNNLYYEEEDKENDETLTVVDFQINNTGLFDDLSDYNDNNDSNLMVYIEGIEFYKKTFKWRIVLDSIVDNIDEDEDENDDADKPDIDFDSLINNADTKSERELVTNKIIKQNNVEPVAPVPRQVSKDTISTMSKPVDIISNNLLSKTQVTGGKSDTVSTISKQPVLNNKSDTVSTMSSVSRNPQTNQTNNKSDSVSTMSKVPIQQSQQRLDTVSTMSKQPITKGRNDDLVSQSRNISPTIKPVQLTDNKPRNLDTMSMASTRGKTLDTQSINQRNIELQSRLNNIENVGNNLSRDIVEELADFDTKSSIRKEIIENVQAKREELQDLESKISQKKIEIESYKSNADRARKVAETLTKKAIDSQSELVKYQEKFNELSQNTSILSKSK